MKTRIIAVALGIAAFAVPSADARPDHGKGHKEEAAEEVVKEGAKGKQKPKKAKTVTFVFKGTFTSPGTVEVSSGNAHVRKGGYVGQDVAFDLSAAKLVVADTDGVPGITPADVQAGDKVLVQARLPRGTKAPAPVEEPTAEAATDEEPAAEEAPAAFKARKLIDLTRPPVAHDEVEQESEQD